MSTVEPRADDVGAGPPAEAGAVNRPTPAAERIVALDVVRGVAILGILLANIQIFRGGQFLQVLRGDVTYARGGADRWVEILTGVLVTNTWLGMFSLLFGIGLALQLARPAGDRFGSARIVVLQRLLWLLAFGYAHRQLTGADILFPYALAGFAVLILAGPSLPPPARWARVLGIGGVAGIVLIPPTWHLSRVARSDAVLAMLDAGSAPAWLEVRALEAMSRQGSLFLILGWFLLGLWVGTSPLLKTIARDAGAWLARGAALAAAGIALRLAYLLPGDPAAWRVGPEPAIWTLAAAGSLCLTLGLALVIAGVAARAGPPGGGRIAAVGRAALSAYLLQSILCVGLFALPNARAAIGPAAALGVVLAVWLLLLLACPWWLARFRFGPAEWLWRTLTHRRPQPFRLRTAQAGVS